MILPISFLALAFPLLHQEAPSAHVVATTSAPQELSAPNQAKSVVQKEKGKEADPTSTQQDKDSAPSVSEALLRAPGFEESNERKKAVQ